MANDGPINLHTLRFLQSDAGTDLLNELKTADLSDANTLRLLTDLRKRYPADIAAAALETARLRIRAREKFPVAQAGSLFTTREALEQATHFAVALKHADHFIADTFPPGTKFDRVFDLGCSIGSDTWALAFYLAQYGTQIIAVDRDPLRLALAQANLAPDHYGQWARLLQADLTQPLPFTKGGAAFFDPARRTGYKRVFSIRDYTPPLDVIFSWSFETLLVKLSPGVDRAELAPYGNTVGFISVNGDLKEALLCRGAFDTGKPWATVIKTEGGYAESQTLTERDQPAPPLREPRGYLYEPDPAVIRAGLLGELAAQLRLEMYRLDETIAYLTADSLVQTLLARAWIVDDWMPFNLKKLRAYMRERNVGRVTVKKRGSPLTPEELIAKLKLPGGGEERVVVLTHVRNQPAVLICRTV
ncbi:MAG: SAM-dependent methyltransferase [Anaerolineae bacterium]|nr:SAM-dependent methyltransferase [Anaerolineae bacterium]